MASAKRVWDNHEIKNIPRGKGNCENSVPVCLAGAGFAVVCMLMHMHAQTTSALVSGDARARACAPLVLHAWPDRQFAHALSRAALAGPGPRGARGRGPGPGGADGIPGRRRRRLHKPAPAPEGACPPVQGGPRVPETANTAGGTSNN